MATTYKYSQKYDKKNMAKAASIGLSISTKQSIEICSRIRNKKIQQAKRILEDAIHLVRPIKLTRFHGDRGHKPGHMGPGRFSVNACKEILMVLNSAENNAQQKGLNTNNLEICHVSAQRGGKQWHYGRLRRRKMKRTHIELFLKETEKTKEDKPKKKADAAEKKTQAAEKKAEVKPVEKKINDAKVEKPKAETQDEKPAPKVEEKKKETKEKQKTEVTEKKEEKKTATKEVKTEEKKDENKEVKKE